MLARPDMTPPKVSGVPAGALAIQAELLGERLKRLHTAPWSGCTLSAALGLDSVWVILRREGHGGLALRTAYAPGGMTASVSRKQDGEWTIDAESALGAHRVDLYQTDHGALRVTTTLTPAADLLIPYLPRDLYPLDDDDSPVETRGTVEAAQRGVNAGLLYFCMKTPAFGNVTTFSGPGGISAWTLSPFASNSRLKSPSMPSTKPGTSTMVVERSRRPAPRSAKSTRPEARHSAAPHSRDPRRAVYRRGA